MWAYRSLKNQKWALRKPRPTRTLLRTLRSRTRGSRNKPSRRQRSLPQTQWTTPIMLSSISSSREMSKTASSETRSWWPRRGWFVSPISGSKISDCLSTIKWRAGSKHLTPAILNWLTDIQPPIRKDSTFRLQTSAKWLLTKWFKKGFGSKAGATWDTKNSLIFPEECLSTMRLSMFDSFSPDTSI